jgi:hypothetical protein
MSIYSGPDIPNDGLVLCIDAANPQSVLTSIEVLVVGGGGAGGGGIGGGGGGGGVVYMPSVIVAPGTGYSMVVGAGGNAVVYSGTSGNGQDSTAFGATAKGGGGSGVHDAGDGVAGGSGGGAASNNGRINQGGASTGNSLGPNSGFIYGNRGGNMLVARTGGPTAAAGGGGAGAAAADTNSNTVQTSPGNANGRGGDGIPNSILGTTYYWGGGGGGGAYFNGYAGNGGLGGGGGGSCSGGSGPTSGGGSALNSGTGAAIDTNGGAGGANTGGGGGGGAWQVTSGGAGGSGIVVVRYPGVQRATGGTVTSVNGNTIHTFTTSDTFTPNTTVSNLVGTGNNGTLIGSPAPTVSNGVFQFNGSNRLDISTINLASGQSTVIGSARYSGATRGRMINSVNNNWLMGQWGNSVANYYAEGWVSAVGTGGTDTVWRIYAATGDTATDTWALYINGALSVSNTFGAAGPNGLSVPNAGEQSIGECGFILAYNRVLSATEILEIFNAFRGRYNI